MLDEAISIADSIALAHLLIGQFQFAGVE